MVGVRIAVAPGFVDEQVHPAGQGVVVRHHQPPFTGGHVLALLQAEAADGAKGSHQLAVVARKKCLGAILDDGDVARSGERHDLAHLAGIPEQVRDDDRPGPRAQPGLDGRRRHVEGVGIDVGEHGDGALVEDRRQRPHIRDRRRDDLVARLRIDRRDGRVDGSRARGARVRVPNAEEVGEAPFERLHERTLRAGEGAAADGLRHQRDLFGPQRPAGGVLIGWQRERCRLGQRGLGHGLVLPSSRVDRYMVVPRWKISLK